MVYEKKFEQVFNVFRHSVDLCSKTNMNMMKRLKTDDLNILNNNNRLYWDECLSQYNRYSSPALNKLKAVQLCNNFKSKIYELKSILF